jgi:two-component system sensor histidine kinase/response regulator
LAGPLILNVDDYVPGRYARTRLLRQIGLPVMEAGSGKEALEMVEQHRPTLVLLDVNLPDMSGIEVCKLIKENRELASTAVVHISASSVLAQHQVLGLDSGADGYIVEPVEPAVLIATVNAFLRARRAEEALLKSIEELRWFSYRVAHDLQEPLRTITIYAELLKSAQAETADGEGPKFLDFIGSAAGRMRTFINGLLDYSQAVGLPVHVNTIDCAAMVKDVVANLDASIKGSGAQIAYDSLPTIISDSRLEHVFQNLIGNAIKYRRQDVTPEIRISARQVGDEWLFSIRDNGTGIDPQYLDKVFEIFHRLHGQDVPGSGIGLAISKKIVEAQGGRIWIESQPGTGSTFYFTLPVKGNSTIEK